MTYGGFSADGESGCWGACDGMPVPSEAWTLATDEHGCKYWVEPREWTDCCGCLPHSRSCNPSGKWKIEYANPVPCGSYSDTFVLMLDDDAGTQKVMFESRNLQGGSCGGSNEGSYEETVSLSENGCVVTLSSHKTWCSGGEGHCEELDLKMYLNPFKANGEVEGTNHECWCGSSGPEGTSVKLKGIAKLVN
jgi:hypothetical protein